MCNVTWIGMLATVCASAQANLPADVDPVSYSRLPVVKRDSLNDSGKKLYDSLAGGPGKTVSPSGLGAIVLYSPSVGETIHMLSEYLRKQGVLGNRLTELAILVAVREIDQQYEWSAHEPAAQRAGVEQSIIDVKKYGREPKDIPEKEAVIIRFGRQLFHENNFAQRRMRRPNSCSANKVWSNWPLYWETMPWLVCYLRPWISIFHPSGNRCCLMSKYRRGRSCPGIGESHQASDSGYPRAACLCGTESGCPPLRLSWRSWRLSSLISTWTASPLPDSGIMVVPLLPRCGN